MNRLGWPSCRQPATSKLQAVEWWATDGSSSTMHARDGMAFVHAVMCARASHLRTTTSLLIAPRIRGCRPAARPGAALSRYSSAPSYDLNARAQGHHRRTHAPGVSTQHHGDREAEWEGAAAGPGAARRTLRRAAGATAEAGACACMLLRRSTTPHASPCSAHCIGPCIGRRRSGGGRRAAAVRAR